MSTLIRIYQKPSGTPADSSVFAIEVLQNNVWMTKKVTWSALKGLIAQAESLTFSEGKLTFTTPDGVAHEVLSVDSTVTSGSGNPVSSGAVSTALASKQDTLTFDSTPVSGGTNPVTSGGIYNALETKQDTLTFDSTPTDGSSNPVTSDGIYEALQTKQDTLTFDNTPTDGSSNPVTSDGIYEAISAIMTGIDWKKAVATYADIATTYPNPQDGWTVTTLDDDNTYRYNGTAWVNVFSLITLASSSSDGLMSSSDFTKLAGIETGANKTTVDDVLKPDSENPVQNKVIYNALQSDALILLLDGTKATYDTIMRKWFLAKGAEYADAARLTELCAEWYEKTRQPWDGYVTFDQPDAAGASTSQYGTKGGDNATLTCTPSTDATHEQDDYEGLPLFACVDVNWVINPTTLDVQITAIDGITTNFKRNDPDVYVGVMQATGWHYQYEDANTYTHGYRASYLATYADIEPLPEAVRMDGSVRPFVVHSKYMAGTNGNKLTACSGEYVQPYVSHNSIHAYYSAQGAGYSGSTTADDAFLKLMTFIKYGSMSLDAIMNGCNSYDGQYYAQVSETGVKRVIVPTNTIIEVNSTVEIGVYNGSSADRGTAANYSISGQKGVKVTAVEDVTIEGTAYKAIYVDTAEVFDTVANGNATTGSTIISTFHWMCGSCDGVKGNDGSPVSNTDNKHPCRLQGIEFLVGGYEVYADVIMNLEAIDSVTYYVPYVVKEASKQANSITADYSGLTDLKIACPASNSWQYPKKLKYKKGVFYLNVLGGNTSTFCRDGFYMNAQGTTGTREWLAFGYLTLGAGAGLSCLRGLIGLTTTLWTCLPRLSPGGNRGEWTA